MNFLKVIKDFIEPIYNKLYNCCVSLFYILPVRNSKVTFVVTHGYQCNPKYIAEEIHRQNLPWDMIWIVDSYNIEIPSYIRKVKYNRIKTVFELATSRIIIGNTKALMPVKKKIGQTFIYIPHGQPGCKCAEGDAILPEDYIKTSKKHSALTDIFVSMGKYHTQVLNDTFWVPETAEIIECGFPRNDQYYTDNSDRIRSIRNKLKVPDGLRIVFYAPTFRDNNNISAYDIDFHRTLDALEKKTGDKWMFFVTLHQNFRWFKHPPYKFDERIWNMSDYIDIHELLLLADVTISDYSSVALDFANTKKPVFLYSSDIDEYKKMRGLKPLYFKMPFALCRNNDELESAIMNFNNDDYQHGLDEFQKIYGSVDDGHASERFVERLKQIVK